ncbi:hypothetical protein ABK040_016127 [Willaertia magna]
MLTVENIHSLNEIFKRNIISLDKENLPNYLNHLNSLYITKKQVPKENEIFQNFTNLKVLRVFRASINDNNLKLLYNLEELWLNSCSKVIGTCFLQLKKLKKLVLQFMNFIDEENLKELNSLEKLCIMNCKKIKGCCLQNLQQLQSLKIYNSNGYTTYFSSLINLKKLNFSVYLYSSNYTFLQKLVNLEKLTIIVKKQLTDNDFINLQKLKYLKLIKESNISGECFKHLINLEHFNCHGAKLPNLKEENLNKNLITLDLGENKISGKYLYLFKNLKQLAFQPNEQFKEDFLQNLSTNLEIFEITGTSEFKGLYLNKLINLKQLNVSSTNIEDKYLMDLKNLTKLEMLCCANIKGDCLLNLINLKELNISFTNISEDFLINLTKLKYLFINGIKNLEVGKFLLNMKYLQYLQCDESFGKEEINEIKLQIKDGKSLQQILKTNLFLK